MNQTTTTKRVKTQNVRTRTKNGTVALTGRLFGGKAGKQSYLSLQTSGIYDEIAGQRLYRLAKAIVRRFEAAQ
jgi:hypothetical protein